MSLLTCVHKTPKGKIKYKGIALSYADWDRRGKWKIRCPECNLEVLGDTWVFTYLKWVVAVLRKKFSSS